MRRFTDGTIGISSAHEARVISRAVTYGQHNRKVNDVVSHPGLPPIYAERIWSPGDKSDDERQANLAKQHRDHVEAEVAFSARTAALGELVLDPERSRIVRVTLRDIADGDTVYRNVLPSDAHRMWSALEAPPTAEQPRPKIELSEDYIAAIYDPIYREIDQQQREREDIAATGRRALELAVRGPMRQLPPLSSHDQAA
jgi:hypothetical protein